MARDFGYDWGGRRSKAKDGQPGLDADPDFIRQAVREEVARLPKPRDGRPADPQHIRTEVARAIESIKAERGPRGPEGPPGPKPDHEWNDTSLRFEKPDGEWGEFVDLRGPRGERGFGGGVSVVQGSDGTFDLDSLPIGDTSTPEEIVVKQHGIWVRITWDQFMTFVGTPPVPLELSLDGDTLSLDGDTLSLV